MRIQDKVYGGVEIREPVLVELIKSTPIQRLKKINQYGISEHKNKHVSRYDHSIGVLLLLKRYGASLQEQIAGLLHDIPHTAFSHVVDFAVGSQASQTFHEKFTKKIVMNSEIPSILKKYKFSVWWLMDKNNFSLFEAPLPNLCADRIDYFLRDSLYYWGSYPEINDFLDHLKVYKGDFVFDELAAAKKFALKFMDLNINFYVSITTLAKFHVLAQAIKVALEKNILQEKNLFETDSFVMKKLASSNNKQIKDLLSLLKTNTHFKEVGKNADFHVRGKVRYVDPKILTNGQTKKLSQLDTSFKEIIPLYRRKVQKGHRIKIAV